MNMTEYDREIKRRLRHRRANVLKDFVECALTAIAFVALVVAFCALTPTQNSAENDWWSDVHAEGGDK